MKPVKPKKCKSCSKMFVPTYNRIQPTCSLECAMKKAKQDAIDKEHKKVKEKVKERDRLGLLMKLAKELAQKYARLRDAELPCISCGATKSEPWQGGHLFKAELYSGVKLDELNINKQCVKCNFKQDGNEAQYVVGFIKKYGQETFNELYDKAEKTRNYKWSVLELQQIIKDYKLKIKENESKSNN